MAVGWYGRFCCLYYNFGVSDSFFTSHFTKVSFVIRALTNLSIATQNFFANKIKLAGAGADSAQSCEAVASPSSWGLGEHFMLT